MKIGEIDNGSMFTLVPNGKLYLKIDHQKSGCIEADYSCYGLCIVSDRDSGILIEMDEDLTCY